MKTNHLAARRACRVIPLELWLGIRALALAASAALFALANPTVQAAPGAGRIMAGMAVPDVDRIIRAAGGRPNSMDLVWPAGTLGRCYEFGPHTAIALSGSATETGVVVANISICRNTDRPAAERRWKPVVSLDLYPGQYGNGAATAPVQTVSATLTQPGATADSISLQYQNSDIRILIDLYRQLTGKKIVFSSVLKGQVTLMHPSPVSRREAIALIEQVFFSNGFWLVDTAPDAIEVGGPGRNPRQQGVPIYSTEQEIPLGERVFTYALKMKYRDPADIHSLVSQYTAPSPYTSVLCDPASHACLVTERTSVIRSVIKLMETFDVALPAKK